MSASDSTDRIVRPPHGGADAALMASFPESSRPLVGQLLETDRFLSGEVQNLSIKMGYMKREFSWVKWGVAALFLPLFFLIYQQITATPPQIFHVQQPAEKKARTAPTSTPVDINDLFCEKSGVSNGTP